MKRAAAIIVAALLAATQALAVGGGIGGGQLNDYAWSSDPTILYSPNLSPSGDGGTWNIDPSGGLGGMFIGHSQFSALLAQFMSTNTAPAGIPALSTNSLRLIQADTQAWASVVSSNCSLFVVGNSNAVSSNAATLVVISFSGFADGGDELAPGDNFSKGGNEWHKTFPGFGNWTVVPNSGKYYLSDPGGVYAGNTCASPMGSWTSTVTHTWVATLTYGGTITNVVGITNSYTLVRSDDGRYMAALTNASAFATAAQGVAATNALALANAQEAGAAAGATAVQPAALGAYLPLAGGQMLGGVGMGGYVLGDIGILLGPNAGYNPLGIGNAMIGYDGDCDGTYGSVSIGQTCQSFGDHGSVAIGMTSTARGSNGCVALGDSATASGEGAVAIGRNTQSSGDHTIAMGYAGIASNMFAFTWGSGNDYGSHGNQTYNIDPAGGTAGFWIGETSLATILAGYDSAGASAAAGAAATQYVNGVASVITNAITAGDSASSNYVLTVALATTNAITYGLGAAATTSGANFAATTNWVNSALSAASATGAVNFAATTQYVNGVALATTNWASGQFSTTTNAINSATQAVLAITVTNNQQNVSLQGNLCITANNNTVIPQFIPQPNGVQVIGNNDDDLYFGLGGTKAYPNWFWYCYENECPSQTNNYEFIYLGNSLAQRDYLMVSEGGRMAFNKQSNILDYHGEWRGYQNGGALDDLDWSGTYTLSKQRYYKVAITNIGAVDHYNWWSSTDNSTFTQIGTNLLCTNVTTNLEYGVQVRFENLTGHNSNDVWVKTAFAQLPTASFHLAPAAYQEVGHTTNYANCAGWRDDTYVAAKNNLQYFRTYLTNTTCAIFIGRYTKFNSTYWQFATNAVGLTLVADYWNGSVWTQFTGLVTNNWTDGTANMSKNGQTSWDKAFMSDWATNNPAGLTDPSYAMYWMRLRTTTVPSTPPTIIDITPQGMYRMAIYGHQYDDNPGWYVDGNCGTYTSNLTVQGSATVSGAQTNSGNTTFSGTVSNLNTVTSWSNMVVYGAQTNNANVTILGALGVTGNVVIAANLSQSSGTTALKALSVNGTAISVNGFADATAGTGLNCRSGTTWVAMDWSAWFPQTTTNGTNVITGAARQSNWYGHILSNTTMQLPYTMVTGSVINIMCTFTGANQVIVWANAGLNFLPPFLGPVWTNTTGAQMQWQVQCISTGQPGNVVPRTNVTARQEFYGPCGSTFSNAGPVVVGGTLTVGGVSSPWLHNVTNEFVMDFPLTVPTNTAMLVTRVNEAQVYTQSISYANSGAAATCTVYALNNYYDWTNATALAVYTNDLIVAGGTWKTNAAYYSLATGGGIAIAFTNGYANVTNTCIMIRTVTP